MKKKVAIWMHGGIGTGHFNQGVPVLEKLLNGLSANFELVIYSLSPVNDGYRSEQFLIRTPPQSVTTNWIRWTCLIGYFSKDHFSRRFNVILSFWGYPAGVIAVTLGRLFWRPSIVYLLGSDAASVPSVDYGILHHRRMRRRAFWAYSRATRLLGISEYQQRQLERFGFRRDLLVIPWGADSSQFSYRDYERSAPLKILHVGHLVPIKDQVTLLKAFITIRRSCPAKLRIVGTDLLHGALQKLCRDSGFEEDVQFVDIQPYHQMPAHFEWADLMMHTSLSEGQCMALTEAAATGVLMAGTRVGILHDLGDSSVIAVEAGDHEGLAGQILSLMSDRAAWNQKVANAHRWAVKHDLKWTIAELTKVLNQF